MDVGQAFVLVDYVASEYLSNLTLSWNCGEHSEFSWKNFAHFFV